MVFQAWYQTDVDKLSEQFYFFFAIWFLQAQISETFFNTNDHNQITLKLRDMQFPKLMGKVLAIQALFYVKSSSVVIIDAWSLDQF